MISPKFKKLPIWDKVFLITIAAGYISGGVSFGSVYLLHIMLAISLFVLLIRPAKYKIGYWDYKIAIYLLWVLYNFFTLLWSWELNYSINTFIIISIGSFVLYLTMVMSSDCNHIVPLFNLLAFVFLIEIAIACIEIITTFRWPFEVGYNNRFAATFIPTGFRGNPNNLTTVLLMAAPFVLSLKYKWKYLIILLILIIVFFAQSRGNLIVLSGYLFYYFLVNQNTVKKIKIVITSVISSLIIFVVSPDFGSLIAKRITASFIIFKNYVFGSVGADNSISNRLLLTEESIKLFQQNPLGIGIGASKKVFEENGFSILSIHNFFIEMLVESGMISLFLFVLMLAIIINSLLSKERMYHRKFNRSMNVLMVETLVITIPAIVSISTGYYFIPLYIVLGLGIGLTNIKNWSQPITYSYKEHKN
ncbi:O-antigen ligase family protein [Salinispira pacifica]|nr:O-antigen ligase family protein [Salinispira pacifica]